jgi:hypothetical protein
MASHPLIEQREGGQKIQESAAYESNKLCCPHSEDPNNPEDQKTKELDRHHNEKPHKPTLDMLPPVNRLHFPSVSLEKRKRLTCAFIPVHCHFSSADFMRFLRVNIHMTNIWFSFYLYPGEPS